MRYIVAAMSGMNDVVTVHCGYMAQSWKSRWEWSFDRCGPDEESFL